MYQKSYSILFCVLLASTFVHELRARRILWVPQVAQISESKDHNTVSQIAHISKSDDREVESSSLIVQAEKEVLIISNSSSGSALLIDVEKSQFVLLNGTSGSCIAVDRKSNKGAYISKGVWKSDSQSLGDFASSLQHGFEDFLTADIATQFELTAVSEEILLESAYIVISLIDLSEEVFLAKLTLCLDLMIAVADKSVELFSGALFGFLELFGGAIIPLPGDVCAFINTLQGISTVIEKTLGSYSEAEENGVELDIESILGANHGLDSFNQLLTQLGGGVSLKQLSDEIGEAEGFFRLISQLGGNVHKGVSGSFKVAYAIVSYSNGHESLDRVLDSAIKYLAHSRHSKPENHSAELKKTLSELTIIIETVNGSGHLDNTAQIVKDLCENKLTVRGVDISQVIDLLIEAAIEPKVDMLEILVDFLLLCVEITELWLSIPYLLVVLISKLGSPTGISELIDIGVEIGESFEGIFDGFLGLILSGIKDKFELFAGDFFLALSGITVIGDIVEHLNTAVEEATHGENDLHKILKSSSSSQDLIKGLFQEMAGHGSDNLVTSSEAQKVLTTSNSIDTAVSLNVTSVVQSSSSS